MANIGSSSGTVTDQNQAIINHEHATKLLAKLNETRKQMCFCDGIVSIGPTQIPVQKSVLCAASDYFRALFDFDERINSSTASKTKNSQSIVSLDSLAGGEDTFNTVLDYIYTAEVVLTPENIQDILQVADELLMGDLKNMCCEYLDSCINAQNCIGIFDFTSKLSCFWSHYKVSTFLDQNFSEVSQSEEFLRLDANQVEEFLSRRTIQLKNEDEVLDTVLRWYQFDVDNRKSETVDLIKKVVFVQQVTEEALGKVKDIPQIGSDCCQAIKELKANQNSPSYIHRGFTRVIVACGGEETLTEESAKDDSDITSKVHCCRADKASRYPYSDWVRLASMNTRRSGHGLVEVGGCMFVAGGRDLNCLILNSCEKYDPFTNKWTTIKPMSHGRVGFGLVAIENYIYALGGSNDITDPLTSVEIYDISINKWSRLPDMLMKRVWASYVAAGKKIYVLGGGVVEKFYESVEVFDTRTLTWSAISPMRERRCDAVAASVDNDIYIFGGFRRIECPSAAHSGHNLKLCGTEFYSEKNDFWMPVQSRHNNPGLCMFGEHSALYSAFHEQGEILIVGELVMNGQRQTIRSYDWKTNTWECAVVNPPPSHHRFPCCGLSMPSQLLYQLLWDQDKLRYSDLFKKNSSETKS